MKHCTISINQVDKIHRNRICKKKVAKKTFQPKFPFQVAMNETVKHCYRPLVSDCDFEGKSFNHWFFSVIVFIN